MWLLKVKLVIIILLSSIFSWFTSFLGSMPCKVMETVFCLNVYVLGSFRLKLLWPLLHYRWTYYYEILFGVLHILKTLVVLMLVSMSLNCEQRTNLQINLSVISQKWSFFFFHFCQMVHQNTPTNQRQKTDRRVESHHNTSSKDNVP